MAGLLSRIFEQGSEERAAGVQAADLPGVDEILARPDDREDGEQAGGGRRSESSSRDEEHEGSSTENRTESEVDASVSVRLDVSLHAEGSYQDLDGNETEWSRDTHLSTGTTEVGTSALVSSLGEMDQDIL